MLGSERKHKGCISQRGSVERGGTVQARNEGEEYYPGIFMLCASDFELNYSRWCCKRGKTMRLQK